MARDLKLSIIILAGLLSAAGCSNNKVAGKPAAAPKAPPRITQFYPSPEAIAPGETVLLCYGVENADQVQMAPPVENVKPVLSRCVPAKPKQTTTYTLTATGAGGTLAATVTVTVSGRVKTGREGEQPKPSSLSFFADHKIVKPGQPVTLCYQAGEASKVEITPRTGGVPLPANGCITERPANTTKFLLSAEFAGGRRETQQVEVRVE